jgi:hypothetical protein
MDILEGGEWQNPISFVTQSCDERGIRLKQKRQLIIHFLQEEVMVELRSLNLQTSHLGCKTLCCFICPMVKRFKMFKGKVFGDLMTHFHKVEFLNIVCDEFPSHRLFYFYMCGWS